MARRRKSGMDYEPLVLYDEPVAMDDFGFVKTVATGGTPTVVINFRGAFRPLRASEVEHGGLDAARDHEEITCRVRSEITTDRIVYRQSTGLYYRISAVVKTYRQRDMQVRVERLTLAPTANVPT